MAVTNQQLHDRLKDIVESLRLIADRPRSIIVPSGRGHNFSQVTAAIESQTTTLSSDLTSIAGFVDGLEALLTTLIGHVDGLEGFTDGIEAQLNEIEINTNQASGSGESIAQLLEKANDLRITGWLSLMDGRLDTINTAVVANAISTAIMVISNAAILVQELLQTADLDDVRVAVETTNLKLETLWPIDNATNDNLVHATVQITNGNLTKDFNIATGSVGQLEGLVFVNTDSAKTLSVGLWNTDASKFLLMANITMSGGTTIMSSMTALQVAIIKHMRFDDKHKLRVISSGCAATKTQDIFLTFSREVGEVD